MIPRARHCFSLASTAALIGMLTACGDGTAAQETQQATQPVTETVTETQTDTASPQSSSPEAAEGSYPTSPPPVSVTAEPSGRPEPSRAGSPTATPEGAAAASAAPLETLADSTAEVFCAVGSHENRHTYQDMQTYTPTACLR